VAETFRGIVESLIRIEHDRETLLDFKLRAGPSAQRVRARLTVADWLREGDTVEADGNKDNEGILLADRVTKSEAPIPVQPSLSALFLIGSSVLINVVYWIMWATVSIADYAGALGLTVAVALLAGATLTAIPSRWKVATKPRLLLRGVGITVIVVGVAKLVDPRGTLYPGFVTLLLGFVAVCVYVIVRWFRRKAQRAPSSSSAG
jgi:uncharacterized membrane protein